MKHEVKAPADKIIITRLEKTSSLLDIPGSVELMPIEGTVVDVGEEVLGITKGNHIMFNPTKAITLKVADVEYIVVTPENVYIIIL